MVYSKASQKLPYLSKRLDLRTRDLQHVHHVNFEPAIIMVVIQTLNSWKSAGFTKKVGFSKQAGYKTKKGFTEKLRFKDKSIWFSKDRKITYLP